MLLAFLVDQTQQRCCPLFQAVWNKRGHHKRSLWEEMRNLFRSVPVRLPAGELYEAIVSGIGCQQPALLGNSS